MESMVDQTTYPPSRSARLPGHEVLSRLARDDPETFEALRYELIEDCIIRAPKRLEPRLRGIQFRLDAIRKLSRSPLGAAVKMHEMMWASFRDLNRELLEFVQVTEGAPRLSAFADDTAKPPVYAKVIAFSPRQSRAGDAPAPLRDHSGARCSPMRPMNSPQGACDGKVRADDAIRS